MIKFTFYKNLLDGVEDVVGGGGKYIPREPVRSNVLDKEQCTPLVWCHKRYRIEDMFKNVQECFSLFFHYHCPPQETRKLFRHFILTDSLLSEMLILQVYCNIYLCTIFILFYIGNTFYPFYQVGAERDIYLFKEIGLQGRGGWQV